MDLISDIIGHFYSGQDELRRILVKHSTQVRDKALQIAEKLPFEIDRETVIRGAMLHDIGIIRCHAPSICCHGELDYIAHGITGAAMLRELDPALEKYARICERHTGSGLTALEIKTAGLPLPELDLLPESLEEKLICLADKFFSKSKDMAEKPLPKVRRSMEKFGIEPLKRFDELCALFSVTE